MESTLGLSHFLVQTDWLAKALLAILLGLSVASWTVILLKGLDNPKMIADDVKRIIKELTQ